MSCQSAWKTRKSSPPLRAIWPRRLPAPSIVALSSGCPIPPTISNCSTHNCSPTRSLILCKHSIFRLVKEEYMSTAIYLNGNIYTMDTAQPRAQALAIDTTSGRILAVGTDDEVRRAGGQHRELIDLQGRTVLPGFIDAHIHALEAAYRSYNIDAASCASEDEVAELVRTRAAQTPPGRWILGGHWDKNGWPGSRFPTKASLDAVASHHPVALWSNDGHVLWVNSQALQRAGITAETPNPKTGEILRDGSGEPIGILK